MDNQQPGPKPIEPATSAGDPAAIHSLSQNGSGLSSHDEGKIASQELAGALIAAATDNLAIPEAIDATVPGAAKPFDRERIADLIAQIKESADKLAADQPSRGDLKILSRTLRELRYAFKVFSPYRSRRKVTVFGSARTRPDKPTYQQAVVFGRKMAECGWLVVTGAASGIMEAGHVGAGRENSMGLNIMLPFEQSSNPIIAGDPKLVHMKYFFTRKLMFVKECDAVACCPAASARSTKGWKCSRCCKPASATWCRSCSSTSPAGKFWQPLIEFFHDRLLADGMISPEDLSLYKVTDSADAAVQEILSFFRVYHSMRYVKNKLVLRLTSSISPELLADINASFRDILVDGQFTVGEAQREEKDEPALIALPRLIFHFNRRSLGRLRQLIDALNNGAVDKMGGRR